MPFPAGYQASCSTPVQWYQAFERKAYSRRHHDSSVNFFNWFFDHNFSGSDWIAEVGSHVATGPELVINVGVVVVHGTAHGLASPVLTLLISLADHHKGSVAQSCAVLCEEEGSTTRGTGRTRGEAPRV